MRVEKLRGSLSGWIVHHIERLGHAGVLDLNQSKKDSAADLVLSHEALYRALARMKQRA